MFSMSKVYLHRHCSGIRLLLVVWLLVLLWNEYLVFVFYSLRWSMLLPQTVAHQDPVMVLFVADPQIIGLRDEPRNIGPISRWDSDRYLQKTFSFVYSHAKPDVVVFLGDLLDEGSQADPEDYDSYVKRFRHVFNIPSSVQIISQSGADVIFSAHSHYSNIIICNDCGSGGPQNRKWKNFQGMTIPVYDYRVYHLDMNNKQQMYEFQVPTCSYRMGVSNMGYGLASFASDGKVQYTVLWLPERYSQLLLYVILLAGTVIGVILLAFLKLGACREVHPR
ncbi:hypothetical protein LSH36_320g06040 [Paralvinella palmiformis]|uniref:Calcineurin-like phosphoesterase domain-containing protein n=1 Tax=Paralvinella palmiformis TaxID=53620 RepID=A0AAD9JHI4_9ANNE|nr:hypothetical protein LSH36_320g06040 [Paralvinella palmiformis]